MEKIKVYFAGSIRGGRDKAEDYKKIASLIEDYAEILDKHVVDLKLKVTGESINQEEIYERDIKWIEKSDIFIAEVTNPSLGVGYEIGYAEKLNKKIICLCEETANISAMIGGNKNLDLIFYSSIDELKDKLIIKMLEEGQKNLV